MALSKQYIKKINGFEGELSAQSIYKVGLIVGDKNNIEFNLNIYINEEIIECKTYNFIPLLDNGNFIKQAYEYLKTLDEFKDAKDI